MMMPLMNGWDFLHAWQRDRVVQAIPVVIISTYRALAEATAPLGVQGALAKPFDMDRLLTTVQRSCPSAPPP
jgi:CheY-like chemotaxis protein